MKGFLSALKFLTIIPLKDRPQTNRGDLRLSTVYFPLVGLILGLILVGANYLLSFIALGQGVISVILVVLLIVFTRGLHLDGLADTFDAFLSCRTKEEMFKIMRDPHIGVMGALSLISVILLKVSFLSSLELNLINASLVLMCLLSRYALVFSMYVFPYARKEGKAKVLIEGMSLNIFSLATIMSVILSIIFFGLKGLMLLMMVVAFVFLINKFITRKIGGVTGDTLGALCELTEVFVLFSVLILRRF